ncbi:hypothetical protein GCM10022406_26950 [Hymenobacter algoricola]|uniref:Uncharacterized protein n=1 Tax=Hymenobacter algoricola TaxID=486267 RepID=A0ABP7NB77_9BACT
MKKARLPAMPGTEIRYGSFQRRFIDVAGDGIEHEQQVTQQNGRSHTGRKREQEKRVGTAPNALWPGTGPTTVV